jgi:ankyrin repeat protein
MADAIVFPTPAEKLMERFRTALLESLRNIAENLSQLADQFGMFTQGIHLSSFIEKSPLPDMVNVVGVSQILSLFSSANIMQLVDEYSGRYGRLVPLLDHDHRQICKHSSFASPGMCNILNELRDITECRSAALASSWDPALVIEPQNGSAAVKMVASLRNDALLRAAATGNIRAVERLINKGADFNTYNSQGETALLLACQHGYASIALRLLHAEADVNGCDIGGNSPLHFASRRSDNELVLMILNRGGDPNRVDKNGATPLHRAAEHGNATTVRYLLDHGANCFIRNSLEELPARIARKNRQLEVMRMLHSHAQNLNQESRVHLYHFEP